MTSLSFHCTPLAGGADLGTTWAPLAAQAPSFFQTRLWVETWFEQVPPDSRVRLCRLGPEEAPHALALLGRHRLGLRGLPLPLHRACLFESGDPLYDRLAVEFNAPLLRSAEALGPFLDGLLAATRRDRELLVARCEPATAAALEAAAERAGRRFRTYRRAVGWLCELPPPGQGDYLDSLSANTRQAIRRSRRRIEAEGELRLEPARDAAEALGYFAELRRLHERTWRSRGDPGAFAAERLVAFHERLIARGFPSAVELLRLSAGRRILGYLYNFRHAGRVYQYQVGLDYPEGNALNLGLLAHWLAIEHARKSGATAYDFLAGDAQYKRQLAGSSYELLSCSVAGRPLLLA